MHEYLVFHLYGPLASWGDIAVGETRPSALTPTKSAVLGLIAAALGLKRPDTVESDEERAEWESRHAALARGYGLAVSVQALGVPLSDYHTAQVPSSGTGRNRRTFLTRRDELTWLPRAELNTILSRREYRQDAFATCALWARENAPHTLAELRDALQEPRFVLYLGRKSCPLALPLKPELMSAEFFEDVLSGVGLRRVLSTLWDETMAERLNGKFGQDVPWLLWDSDAETCLTAELTVTRRDEPLSRRRWQFSVREERRAHGQGEGKP
jgi:CRISPR system Cascade subunit CasD